MDKKRRASIIGNDGVVRAGMTLRAARVRDAQGCKERSCKAKVELACADGHLAEEANADELQADMAESDNDRAKFEIRIKRLAHLSAQSA